MPLKKGKSEKTISKNIKEFHGGKTYAKTAEKFGKERADKQAVAAALDTARRSPGAGTAPPPPPAPTSKWTTLTDGKIQQKPF